MPRLADSHIRMLVSEEPAVLIEGPRGSGKSTVLRAIAAEYGVPVVDLDDLPTRAAILEGSTGPLLSPELVVVDEFQHAPGVLSIVKRVVDREGGQRRFLLAGSVSGRLLPAGTETLTGRVHRVALMPLAAGEVLGAPPQWLAEVLATGEPPTVRSEVGRDSVFELVACGGYPGALARPTTRLRGRWFASYLSTVADRDLPNLVDIRNPGAISRLYRLSAERTASVVTMTELAQRLDIKPQTTRSYLDLLDRCYLVHELPSWTVGLSARVGRKPKLHVTDTGLAAAVLGLDAARLGRMAVGGSFLESFVVTELIKQAAMIDQPLTLSHFRDRTGTEVDLVVERSDGSVIAVEVKSAATVNRSDGKGLRFLGDKLGDRLIAGVVFHTGPLTVQLDDRIWATPVSALWGGTGLASGQNEPS
ncbi:MAG: ATP-binding protein [Acidimicrobiia bacterium]|nr:ATP-binding protein [Acidimicrobiia bacterium]